MCWADNSHLKMSYFAVATEACVVQYCGTLPPGPDGQSIVSANKGDVDLSVQLYAAVDIDFSAREISFPPPSMGAVSFEGSQRVSAGSMSAKGTYLAGSRTDSSSTRSSGKVSGGMGVRGDERRGRGVIRGVGV